MQSTTATVRKTDTWMSTWTNKDTVKRRNPRVLSDVQLPRKSKLRDGYLCRRESTSNRQIHSPGSVYNGTIKINCSKDSSQSYLPFVACLICRPCLRCWLQRFTTLDGVWRFLLISCSEVCYFCWRMQCYFLHAQGVNCSCKSSKLS